MVKMVTCVIVGPNLDLVPVHEMTLEQAREAVETLAADLRRLNRCNEMDREVREIIAESRERRRRSFWG